MQIFRLMGMPDRVLAFDKLPARLLEGFEDCRAEGFPRHWREWMGKRPKVTKVPPERDFMTQQVRVFQPIVEEDCFFYLVDYNSNPMMEKWKEVCDFVRQHVSKDVRLMERIEDMAVPLAANKTDGVTLEPENVPIIPIPVEYQETKEALILPTETKVTPTESIAPHGTIKCDQCETEYKGKFAKNALRMHIMAKHKKQAVAA